MHENNLEMLHARYYDLMLNAINSVYQHNDLESRITGMLETIGKFLRVSRVYVFEDDFENGISKNTYEWCAKGVAPQMTELQAVPHSSVSEWHKMLREDGIIIADTINKLPEKIRSQLSVQGILSILVLPLYSGDSLFGFVGFDECFEYRNWSGDEIKVLRALSELIMSQVARQNAERQANASRRMFRTVLNNIDTPIFVTDLETSRILFANRKFSEEMCCENAEGKLCWKVAAENKDSECKKCPRKKLQQMDPGAVLRWEVYKTGKWYYCTDRLIEWTDGKTAHLQAALDITERKEYEERLKFSAAFDKMTGAYNRESGLKMFKKMVEEGKRDRFIITFCFLDVDGLKRVNDGFGHMEGDRLLICVAETIRECISSRDIFARLGGDEFMLALRECSIDNANLLFERIKQKLSLCSHSSSYPYELSVSLGAVEITPETDFGVDSALIESDRLMYLDKQRKSLCRD